MEERYKKYIEKAKSVIKTLDPKQNPNAAPETMALRTQLNEKDRLLETLEKFDKFGEMAIPARTIRTGDYELDIDILVNNKTVAFAIMGYGAVTSFIFIFIAMMRSLGSELSNYNSTNKFRAEKKGNE